MESEVDFGFNGTLRLLRFVRTYNSRSDHVGAFGPGWASWADARLVGGADGAHYTSPEGQVAFFPRTPEGYARLPQVAGLVEDTEVGLTLVLFGGARVDFDAEGFPASAKRGPGTNQERACGASVRPAAAQRAKRSSGHSSTRSRRNAHRATASLRGTSSRRTSSRSAELRSGAPFVTRTAPGFGPNVGGGVEVVVPEGGVSLRGFSYVGPKGAM